MYIITQGYKKGRAVSFYDLFDTETKITSERVTKDEVVKLCESGQVKDTKIQWWEGKPIVRCSNKDLPIVKISDDGEVVGQIQIATRNHNKEVVKQEVEVQPTLDISDKGIVVGNMKQRKKRETIFPGISGYDRSHQIKQHELKSTVSHKDIDTVEDLFMLMATDYGLKEKELYLSEFSKKIDVSKKLASLAAGYISAIQNSANNYLMNMRNKETNELFIKYRAM